MFYRIRIDLAFTNWDCIDDIRDKALDKLSEALTINPGNPNEEKGFIIVEECYHDEQPLAPCALLSEEYTP